jgi:hypothetical protein
VKFESFDCSGQCLSRCSTDHDVRAKYREPVLGVVHGAAPGCLMYATGYRTGIQRKSYKSAVALGRKRDHAGFAFLIRAPARRDAQYLVILAETSRRSSALIDFRPIRGEAS